jgi:PAS domain S-box-containing protein
MNISRILIVEDEGIVAMEIEERLMAMGYQLIGSAAAGEDALELVDRHRPDLVLMDIRLKGVMDGIEAAEIILQKYHIPVIFITAYSEETTLERAKVAEPYGYLLKPFDDRELKSAIEIGLYKHRVEEDIRRMNRLYNVLSQVNQSIVRITTREELLPSICRLVVERGAIDLAWIGWLDAETSQIRPVASFGKQNQILSEANHFADDRPEGQSNPGKAIREGNPCVCNACPQPTCLYPEAKQPAAFGFKSCGSFPLRLQGNVCGALNLCTTEPGFFREREYELLKEVAMDISFALDKFESDALQKQTENALRESEERLQLFIEYAPASLAMFDRNMRYLNVSRRWLSDFHIEDRNLRGLSHYDVFPEFPEAWKAVHGRVLAGEVLRSDNDRFERADGSVQWIHWEARPWYDRAGDVAGIVIFCEDVTERKQSEAQKARLEAQLQQSQKMESIGRLAGGVAHDFNNMLGIILGHAEMAMDTLDPSQPVHADLEEICKAANRSAALTRQLLAFARKQTTSPKVLNLNETVEWMLKMLRRLIGEDIALTWLPGLNLWSVHIDPSQIDQILANLCVNARDAITGVGKLSIETKNIVFDKNRCTSHEDCEPGEYVMLAVSDNGSGMDQETLARIFEPFFTTKERGKGTGLGLSTVYGIVKQNKGFIDVHSQPEQGTIFTIYLPRHAGGVDPWLVDDPQTPAERGHETILLVEDEPSVLKMTGTMLKKLGYTVLAAGDPAQAVHLATSHPGRIDLIVTDVVMPEMNGKDMFTNLLSIYPNAGCLFMSGHTADVIGQLGVLDPGVDFIQKPFSMKDLASKVRKAINR